MLMDYFSYLPTPRATSYGAIIADLPGNAFKNRVFGAAIIYQMEHHHVE